MVWWTEIIQRHQRPAQRPSKVRPRISPRPHPTGRGYIRPRRDWCLYCRAHLRFNECLAIAGVRTSVSNDDPKEVATLRAFERLHHVTSSDRRDSFYDPLDIASDARCLRNHGCCHFPFATSAMASICSLGNLTSKTCTSSQRFQPPSVARLHRHQKSIGADTACKFGRDDCGFSALIFVAGSSAQRRHASTR
jgi:hypothetical protein